MSVTTFDNLKGSTAPTIVTDFEEFPEDGIISPTAADYNAANNNTLHRTFDSSQQSTNDGIDVVYGDKNITTDSFTGWNSTWTGRIVKARNFKRTVFCLVILNSIEMLIGTFGIIPDNVSIIIRRAFLSLFSVEMVLKLVHYRLFKFWRKSLWLVFDLLVITSSWFCSSVLILRTFRVLKSLKHFSRFPQLRRMRLAMGHAIPGILSTLLLMGIVLYGFAVLLTTGVEGFETIPKSTWSLVRIMTLDRWSELSWGVMREYPSSWIYFVVFIFMTNFAIFNLGVGVVVQAVLLQQNNNKGVLVMMDDVHHRNDNAHINSENERADLTRLEYQLDQLTGFIETLALRQQKLQDMIQQQRDDENDCLMTTRTDSNNSQPPPEGDAATTAERSIVTF